MHMKSMHLGGRADASLHAPVPTCAIINVLKVTTEILHFRRRLLACVTSRNSLNKQQHKNDV